MNPHLYHTQRYLNGVFLSEGFPPIRSALRNSESELANEKRERDKNHPKFDLLRPAMQKLYSVLRALLHVLFEVKGQVRSILNLAIKVKVNLETCTVNIIYLERRFLTWKQISHWKNYYQLGHYELANKQITLETK